MLFYVIHRQRFHGIRALHLFTIHLEQDEMKSVSLDTHWVVAEGVCGGGGGGGG